MSKILAGMAALALMIMLALPNSANAAERRSDGVRAKGPGAETEFSAQWRYRRWGGYRGYWGARRFGYWGPRYRYGYWGPRYRYGYWRPRYAGWGYPYYARPYWGGYGYYPAYYRPYPVVSVGFGWGWGRRWWW